MTMAIDPLIQQQQDIMNRYHAAIVAQEQAQSRAKQQWDRENAEVQATFEREQQQINKYPNEIKGHHAAARLAVDSSPWKDKANGGTAQSGIGLASGDQQQLIALASRASEAHQQIQSFLTRHRAPDQVRTVWGWTTGITVGIIGCVLFAVALSASNNDGTVGCITFLMIIGVWVGAWVLAVQMVYQGLRTPWATLAWCEGRADYLAQQMLRPPQEAQRKRLQDNQDRYNAAIRQAHGALQSTLQSLRPIMEDYAQRSGLYGTAWESPLWQEWRPNEDAQVTVERIGMIWPGSRRELFPIPALLPFPGTGALLFETPTGSKEMASKAIESLLLRLLATIPAAKTKFLFLDPIGLGQNVAPFMHLADHDEAFITGKAWTEQHHIEQQLVNITEHMENVIQKYLRNQYATIEEYNRQAGEVAEAYRIVAVYDFPASFTDAAAKRLIAIAKNGPRCGVYPVILYDPAQPKPYGFNIEELKQSSTVFTWDGAHFVWQDDHYRDSALILDTPPPAETFERMVNEEGKVAVEASKVEVPFEKIVPDAALWWRGETTDGITVPLGPSGARKLQRLDLGKGTAQHALVVGKTGSGKSTLLHAMITNLALTYSPRELELYLIDFKEGVEFKPYATHHLPHARVIAIESEREFGLSVLQGLEAEIKTRGERFRAFNADSLADYRAKSSEKLPRILLLVDEFQVFFVEDDPIATQASQILDRLVRQGRAFGIHVVLGSQTLAGAYTLARATIDQMAVRIALQCSEADSRLVFSDDNPAARLLSRPGEAIYNAANGLVEGNNRFQVAWLSDDQQDYYLNEIQRLADGKYASQQIVFEGNATAEVEKNKQLMSLFALPNWPAPAPMDLIWVGDPIAIRDPVAVNFRRQSGSNLLIIGQNQESALGIMQIGMLSLAAQHAPTPVSASNSSIPALFYILDFSAVDGPDAEAFPTLASDIPHPLRVVRRRHLPETIAEVATEVQRRVEAEATLDTPIYLIVYGLQRARDLRQDDFGMPSYGDETAQANPAQQFVNILRDGPDVGVFSLVWCDTMTNLNRSLERRALREFTMRIAFQMSAEDSTNLIDTTLAGKLGPYRALFYSEDEGRQEKFRPYGQPSDTWLRQAGEQLRQKTR